MARSASAAVSFEFVFGKAFEVEKARAISSNLERTRCRTEIHNTLIQ